MAKHKAQFDDKKIARNERRVKMRAIESLAKDAEEGHFRETLGSFKMLAIWISVAGGLTITMVLAQYFFGPLPQKIINVFLVLIVTWTACFIPISICRSIRTNRHKKVWLNAARELPRPTRFNRDYRRSGGYENGATRIESNNRK